MKIFVYTISGETITLPDVEDTNTVKDIKERIEELEGIPIENQRLNFEGKEMEDERNLQFYRVQDSSTVHLNIDLPGGGGLHLVPRNLYDLAQFYLTNKNICRKCSGRLPANATRCRKSKCGRTFDVRPKRKFFRKETTFKKLSDFLKLPGK